MAEGRQTTGWKGARRDGQEPRPAAVVVSRFELMTLPACLRARGPCAWISGRGNHDWQPPSTHHDPVGAGVIRQSVVHTETRRQTPSPSPRLRHSPSPEPAIPEPMPAIRVPITPRRLLRRMAVCPPQARTPNTNVVSVEGVLRIWCCGSARNQRRQMAAG